MADIVFPGKTSGKLNSSAMPQTYDLEIYRGDDCEFLLQIKDSVGAPIVLTGGTPKAQLKVDYYDQAPIDFTCTLTGTPGEVKVTLPASITSTLLSPNYIWDIQITLSTKVRTYLAGDVVVYPDVTR